MTVHTQLHNRETGDHVQRRWSEVRRNVEHEIGRSLGNEGAHAWFDGLEAEVSLCDLATMCGSVLFAVFEDARRFGAGQQPDWAPTEERLRASIERAWSALEEYEETVGLEAWYDDPLFPPLPYDDVRRAMADALGELAALQAIVYRAHKRF